LTSCKFYLRKQGLPVGNMRGRLYKHSGVYGVSSVPDEATVYDESANVAMASLGAYALITFTFSGGYLMVSGTHYCIAVINHDATTLDTSNTPYFGFDSAGTHGGNCSLFFKPDGAAAWQSYAGFDALFYVYGGIPSVKVNGGLVSLAKLNDILLTKVKGRNVAPFNIRMRPNGRPTV
jgi:hypothetical protein